MTENKRFIVETDDGLVISIKDNMTKKHIFILACENIDDYENIFDELVNITVQLNKLWEQVLRFESYSRGKLNDLGMIDKIITKTDLDNHNACVSTIRRIDELTNGYGDV